MVGENGIGDGLRRVCRDQPLPGWQHLQDWTGIEIVPQVVSLLLFLLFLLFLGYMYLLIDVCVFFFFFFFSLCASVPNFITPWEPVVSLAQKTILANTF